MYSEVPTFYHGTDARILRMSPDEIRSFKQDIIKALDYLWLFFKPYSGDMECLKGPLGYDMDTSLYCQTSMAISINMHRLTSMKLWQYEGLYLTNWDWQAWSYSRRAYCFGELGMVAQILITSAGKIRFRGWKPDYDTKRAMDRIMSFSKVKPEPVVVVLDNLEIEHIKDAGGGELKEGSCSRVFMYDKDINLNDYPVLDDKPYGDSISGMLEYRDGKLIDPRQFHSYPEDESR